MVDVVKKIFAFLSIVTILLIVLAYLFIVIFTPKLLNSAKFINYVKNKIEKRGYNLETVNYGYSINKSLTSTVYSDNITLKDSNNRIVFFVKNLNIRYVLLKPDKSLIEADRVYFDKTLLKKSDKKTKINLNHKKLPSFNIKNAEIIIDNNNPLKINISNLTAEKKEAEYTIDFSSTVNSSLINTPIYIPKSVLTLNNNIINFKQFEIDIDKTSVFVDGIYDLNNEYDLTIESSNLSVTYLEKTFLYFMKQKEPNNKNFIENFYDFKGKCSLNLNFKNNSITGYADLEDFSAKYVNFSIPLYFKTARFNFDKDEITLSEDGLIGEQKAHTDFRAENIFSKDKLIKGTVRAIANNDFAKKYIDNLEIIGNVDLKLDYTVFNREITVDYLANLKKGTSVIYNDAYLEKKDENRRLYAKTFKSGNTMYLKEFDYSTLKNGEIKNIFIGNGQFDRYDNKYHLNYISCKTAEPTPVTIFGFFNKLIKSGFFEGDVKYTAKDMQITGNFSLFDTKYKNFFVKSAKVKGDKNKIIINAEGTFENEPYKAYIDVNNTLYDKIVANDIDLYLKKYEIKKSNSKAKNSKKIVNQVKNAGITIKKGKIKLDKLIFKNIVLENLILNGLIDDNIAYFDMPDIDFAKGKLSARGTYDLDLKSSNIDFTAVDIDSNLASDMIFNLKNQFEGKANASLLFKSYESLNIIDSHANFSILDGALTKLGNKEFLVKKSKDSKRILKFKLTDIINVNEKQIKSIRSNLYGNFDLHNNQVENAEIFAKQKYVSIYLTGNYNIKSQYADVDIFGKYNKNAQKGIRILFIPLSWITKAVFNKSISKDLYSDKLQKIPEITVNSSDEETFIVKLKGNPNNNSTIKVEMKSLK